MFTHLTTNITFRLQLLFASKMQGFTAASESGCVDGLKPVYWTDDSDDDGVSIRSGTVECGQFLTE